MPFTYLPFRRKNYCNYKCIRFQKVLTNTGIPAIEQNQGIQQIKIQKGGTPQFRHFQINQFGRYVGTGGRAPTNFS
jgi:hypothetical protein